MSDVEIYVINHKKVEYKIRDHIVGFMEDLTLPSRFYKIGKAADVDRRLTELDAGTPHKLELVTTIESDDPETVEHRLHRIFRMSQVSGEWFKLISNAVNSLKALERLSADEAKHALGEIDGGTFNTSLYVEVMQCRQATKTGVGHA